jgi:hypothetical protein
MVILYHTSMDQTPIDWKADICWIDQEIPNFYGTTFTKSRYKTQMHPIGSSQHNYL